MHPSICLKTALPLPPVFEQRPEGSGGASPGDPGGNSKCKGPECAWSAQGAVWPEQVDGGE